MVALPATDAIWPNVTRSAFPNQQLGTLKGLGCLARDQAAQFQFSRLQALAFSFPALLSIAANRVATAADYATRVANRLVWTLLLK
ncbi:hypothetical protein AMTR_s00027p00221270 [Amborella trichopoda]|uniref:Uncharacterized protein n=1 Tax=Amborella trichopoda TaxID=13333 RepID=W1PLB1_AMBTC|nr:hypothetical protein AMTR_s00027p00221270 [Amborella trichopoda]